MKTVTVVEVTESPGNARSHEAGAGTVSLPIVANARSSRAQGSRIPLAPDSAMSGALERRCDSSGVAAPVNTGSPPGTGDGSPVYLWCPECQEVVDEPGSRDCGGLLCDVCNSNLVDTHGCVDCGNAVGSPEDDWCIGCLAQWAARERADELTAVLVDIAMTPWGVSHG